MIKDNWEKYIIRYFIWYF